MAEGSWVNVPGKGRRWRQPSGELMMTKPGFGQGEFFQTRMGEIGTAGMGAVQGAVDFLNRAGIGRGGSSSSSTNERPIGTQAVLGGKPVYWGGNDYGWQQLSGGGTSATLNALNPASTSQDKTLVSISDPAERAYQTEKARIAQQVAQDPAISQYDRNRAAAVATGDQAKMNAVRDEGMRIWAEKNPELAKKVKPGQSGYEAIQGVLNQGAMGAPMDIPFNPVSLLGGNAIESVPSYGGISDLQPVGTPLPRTQFDTPQNQAMAQMYNRFMTGPYAGSSQAPATNPAEATYATATNVQPIGDINLNAFSFNTPAEKRRGELFQRLLNNTLAVQ
jgi:hypothetical protein